jgi:rod shape-determining protein MreC
MLERSRLRGVLHGTLSGIPEILHIMADEKIENGEPVVSSGGDQIYPRGLPIGTVFNTAPDPEGGPFMVVRVKPAANLDKVEEVLVITKIVEKEGVAPETATSLRAADILAQRLPTVVPKPPGTADAEPPSTAVLYAKKPAAAVSGTGSRNENVSEERSEAPKHSVKPAADASAEGGRPSTGAIPSAASTPKISTPKKPGPPKVPEQSGAQTPQERPQ